MLYRTMLDNENMDMQDPQYIPNVNDTNPTQQSEMGPQYMPFMGYPMMDEMYNSPPTYGLETPQQQYQAPEGTGQDMSRASHDHDSYQQGYEQGHQHGYQQGYHQGYYHHNNNFPFNNLFPFLFLPLFFGRD
ncbi:hypothetical protein G9F72_010300 [Clostridium estertheticum]|uniref:hypothetical protein n=1 Tax=Clostridium estertheticum TaxID=238834 RepID=UPI0013E97318|nr:hypothetical protein [Clostridium estertheticum]MBZ9686715.1 hypothetical protein [Clostridium estertheticum]